MCSTRTVVCCLLLVSVSLQLQSAWAVSPWTTQHVRFQSVTTATSLIHSVEKYFKVSLLFTAVRYIVVYLMQDGLQSIGEKSICDHIQSLLVPLRSSGKIRLSGPPTLDKSLLTDIKFWVPASIQQKQCKISSI